VRETFKLFELENGKITRDSLLAVASAMGKTLSDGEIDSMLIVGEGGRGGSFGRRPTATATGGLTRTSFCPFCARRDSSEYF
jgi:hypothetical protein